MSGRVSSAARGVGGVVAASGAGGAPASGGVVVAGASAGLIHSQVSTSATTTATAPPAIHCIEVERSTSVPVSERAELFLYRVGEVDRRRRRRGALGRRRVDGAVE